MKKTHSALLALVRTRVENVTIQSFTNAGLHFYGTTVFGANANNSSVTYAYVENCGIGVYVLGGDIGACMFDRVSMSGIGSPYPAEIGGVGIWDASGNGDNTWIGYLIEDTTGPAVWTEEGNPTRHAFIGGYVETGGSVPSQIIGLLLGGTQGAAFTNMDFLTGMLNEYWYNITSIDDTDPRAPQITLQQRNFASNIHTTSNEGGYFLLDRYFPNPNSTAVEAGTWATSIMTGSLLLERPVHGFTMGQSQLGPGHLRNFYGEFRGLPSTTYLTAYDFDSDNTQFLRAGSGVGGQFTVGDRVEVVGGVPGTSVGTICIQEGWIPRDPNWTPSTVYTYNTSGLPANTVLATVGGQDYTFACTASNATQLSGATAPTWPSADLGGIVAFRWRPGMMVKVGDYVHPTNTTSIGGTDHYYMCTSVTSPDINNYGVTDSTTEPTWNTGAGSTTNEVSGSLVWTEQGAVASTLVQDNDVEWQRIGPVPVFGNYGKIYAAGTLILDVSTLSATVDLSSTQAAYETIKLIGTLGANMTFTIPPYDGWSSRIVDDTTAMGNTITFAPYGFGAGSVTSTNGTTQRFFMDLDPTGPSYSLHPESAAIAYP